MDTAADATIISENMYEKLNIQNKEFENIKMHSAAENQTFNAKKIGPVKITVGKDTFSRHIFVAPIIDNMLLGMDMLKVMEAKIDIKKKTIQCKEHTLPLTQTSRLWDRGKKESFPATLAKKVKIKAGSETVVPIQVQGINIRRTMYLEPLQEMPVLIARAVYTNTARPLVSFTNNSASTIHLKKGTEIGMFHQIDDSEIVTNDRITTTTKEKKNHSQTEHILPDKLKQLWEEAGKDLLNEKEKELLKETLLEFQGVFSDNNYDLGEFDAIQHEINTGDAKPVKLGLRRTPYHFAEEEEKLLKTMLDAGIISPSTSSWAAAPVLVKKKSGEYRYCLDYRALNKVTTKDVYPIPIMSECMDSLVGNIFFSKLDANQAYYQVPVHPDSKHKTAFRTKHGLYMFEKMPFGLANAPSTFSRAMNLVLNGLNWKTVLSFLDDLCVLGTSFQNHLQNLRQVLERFQEFKLKLKPKKCELFKDEIEFLGRRVGRNGVTMADHSLETIKNWKAPKTFKEVQQFLGFANYHRQFLKDFADTCEPLHEIIKRKKFVWKKEQEAAFQILKIQLSSPPVLAIPTTDGRFILDTDASNFAVGAELLQVQGDQIVTIGYGSFTMTNQQRRYCTTRRELLAVVRFTNHFRHYLLGKEFLLRTDHNSLTWLTSFKNLDGQLARWMEELSRFSMTLKHRAGTLHVNADALSRPTGEEICPDLKDLPCGGCSHCEKIQNKWKSFEENIDDTTSLATSFLKITRVTSTIMEPDQSLEIEWPKETMPHIRQITPSPTNSILENKKLVQTAQQKDKKLTFLYEWLTTNKEPDDGVLKLAGPDEKFYYNNKNMFFMADNLVHMKDEENDIVVIPDELKEEVVRLSHDLPSSGHQGIQRTKEKIKKSFFWFKMSKDVQKFILGCKECNRNKSGRKNIYPIVQYHAGIPMEKVHIDFIGPLPRSKKGNEHILVISDNFSKWSECIPLPNQSAELTARTAVNEFFTRFGFPSQIISDQGRNFDGHLFAEMCKLLKIKKSRTTPYRPSSNGQAERNNRTLIAAVRCVIEEQDDLWDEWMPQLNMAMRSAVNRNTGMTPNMMMLGREINTPMELTIPGKDSDPKSPEEYCTKLQTSLQKTHEIARDCLKTQLKRAKSDHDVKSKIQEFKSGDIVYILDKARINKLKPLYRGPALITEVLSPCNFRVLIDNHNSKIVNHDMIKLCGDKLIPRWITQRRTSLLEEKEVTYCICKKPDDGFQMIQCDKCQEWFHCHCMHLSKANTLKLKEFLCPRCKN